MTTANPTTKQKLDTKSSSNARLGLLVAGVGIIGLLNLATSFLFGAMSLGNSGSQNMVQLADGKTVQAKTASRTERNPIVIRTFVERMMTGLYTMDGYLPRTSIEETNNPKPDPGIAIKGGFGRVTTSAWEISFGLEPKLRKEILEELAGITPKSVLKQKKSIVFIPNYIGDPIPVEGKPGYWTVNLVSTLIAFENGEQLGDVIPLNKKIYLRAVTPPVYREFTNPVTQLAAEIRASGLEIYFMSDLEQEELEQGNW